MNVILEHWKHPVQKESRPDADLKGRAVSHACGDEITVYLFVDNGVVRDAYFNGEGCTICLGMASLLTQHLIGLPVDQVRILTDERVLAMAGVEIERRRHGCALVALEALRAAFV